MVGPNGSGKSNVIDAMLFVFGKRAAQMRLKKLPELIHRSDAYPDLEYAQVSVHFQEIIDYLVRARVRADICLQVCSCRFLWHGSIGLNRFHSRPPRL